MTDQQPVRREVAPRDVFARSNMPSRWERIWQVAPKMPTDREYLAFVAARYRGERRSALPEDVARPVEFQSRERTRRAGWATAAAATVLILIGAAAHLAALITVGCLVLICAAGAMLLVWRSTEPAVQRYRAQRGRSEQDENRLHADPMDAENTATVDQMILCDEGTLTYCAAKIAAEIERDPHWRSARAESVALFDLRDELAEVAEFARQINEDRATTEALQRGRLRDDPEVKADIEAYLQQRTDAMAILAARVNRFADRRDRIHRVGIAARREQIALERTVRAAYDELTRDPLP